MVAFLSSYDPLKITSGSSASMVSKSVRIRIARRSSRSLRQRRCNCAGRIERYVSSWKMTRERWTRNDAFAGDFRLICRVLESALDGAKKSRSPARRAFKENAIGRGFTRQRAADGAAPQKECAALRSDPSFSGIGVTSRTSERGCKSVRRSAVRLAARPCCTGAMRRFRSG